MSDFSDPIEPMYKPWALLTWWWGPPLPFYAHWPPAADGNPHPSHVLNHIKKEKVGEVPPPPTPHPSLVP